MAALDDDSLSDASLIEDDEEEGPSKMETDDEVIPPVLFFVDTSFYGKTAPSCKRASIEKGKSFFAHL